MIILQTKKIIPTSPEAFTTVLKICTSFADFAKAELFYRTFCLVKSIFHQTESKFKGPTSLSGILTNKSEISLVATLFCSCKHFYTAHVAPCSFFNEKVVRKICVPVPALAEEI